MTLTECLVHTQTSSQTLTPSQTVSTENCTITTGKLIHHFQEINLVGNNADLITGKQTTKIYFYFQHFEVKELESTIDNLRGDVDHMAKTVTQLTDGKGKP